MAFLFIKSLITGRRSLASYSLLPNHNTDSRESSFDSSSNFRGEMSDKTPHEPSSISSSSSSYPKSGFRIDPRIISDATIGLSDGLTVPFALTAGLSALGDTRVVIYGGLAELVAGAISMGLGGYLGAKSEA